MPVGLVKLLKVSGVTFVKTGVENFKAAYFQSPSRLLCRWSGGAMALGKLPVPGRPTIWMIVGQGPTALAVGAGGGCLDILLSSILSLLCLPLFGRRPDID